MGDQRRRRPDRRPLRDRRRERAIACFAGIDVGGRRKGFHAAALDEHGLVAGPLRLPDVAAAVAWIAALRPQVVGLDSPISCAPAGQRSRPDERALARAVCGIRWTPERSALAGNPYYEWVEHGLELQDELVRRLPGIDVIEVYPTAAWTIWEGPRGSVPRAEWSARALASLDVPGVTAAGLDQDERDSIAAALTARLHAAGHVRRFGEIVVPDRRP